MISCASLLAQGNVNPGIGTKNIFGDIFESRSRNRARVYCKEPLDVDNNNVDVEVEYRHGRRYTATFFTLRNVFEMFEKNKLSGECGGRLCFFTADRIVVERRTLDIITRLRELELMLCPVSSLTPTTSRHGSD